MGALDPHTDLPAHIPSFVPHCLYYEDTDVTKPEIYTEFRIPICKHEFFPSAGARAPSAGICAKHIPRKP